jgi:hypothetical protein
VSVDISTIASLVSQFPLGLMTAHHWYSDHPTDSDFTFSGTGVFSGGDLPFGFIYELHSLPAGARYDWRDSISFAHVWGHIVNNAAILGGYSSTLPVEEFFFTRPRGIFRFHEPTTESIVMELVDGAEAQIWGLYIDIPFITPTQMTWAASGTTAPSFPTYFDGTSGGVVTGFGEVLLDPGAIGVRLDVFGLPDSYGRDLVDPLIVFDLGWIQFGNSVGWEARQRLEKEHQVFWAVEPLTADRVSYALNAGIGATITSLLPN